MPTVCLAMIVRNEAHCLARCLRSVRPFIDAWVIVDTGSTDATPMIPRQVLEGIPGEVVHRAWKDFSTNRNEALRLAWERADYALVIDADDELESDLLVPPELTADIGHLLVTHDAIAHWRPHMLKRDSGRYEGVVHEGFAGREGATRQNVPGITYKIVGGGARSRDPQRFLNDAALLGQVLQTEPTNARAAFYLAQSLRDAGLKVKARDAYGRRAAMGGDPEEVWYALYQLAELSVEIGESDGVIVDAYLWAYEARPTRAEPLRSLAQYLFERGRAVAAGAFMRMADAIPLPPGDCLFLDPAAYRKI